MRRHMSGQFQNQVHYVQYAPPTYQVHPGYAQTYAPPPYTYPYGYPVQQQQQQQGGGVVGSVVDGAAALGTCGAWWTFIKCCVVACIFLAIGIYCLTAKTLYANKTDVRAAPPPADPPACKSRLVQIKDSSGKDATATMYECKVPIQYTAADRMYTCKLKTDTTVNYAEAPLPPSVFYNQDDPSQCSLDSDSMVKTGWVFVGVAAAIVLLAGLHVYMVQNCKCLAAAEGATTAFGAVGSLFGGQRK